MRHDAHRFAPPSVQTKSFAARRIEQRQAAEAEARLAAEQSALREDFAHLQWAVADLKCELAWRRLCRKYGYNPGQLRVPAGNPDGGQWTTDGGSEASTSASSTARVAATAGRPTQSEGRILSDANPDPIKPGTQFAGARIEIDPQVLTGEETVDRTTVALTKRLANVVDALEVLPVQSGPGYGMLVHDTLKWSLRIFPIEGVEVEPTLGGTGIYGSKGSVRPDIRLKNEAGDTLAYYDYKTGGATVSGPYADKIRDVEGGGRWIPVIQLNVTRGSRIKSRTHPHFDRWCDVS